MIFNDICLFVVNKLVEFVNWEIEKVMRNVVVGFLQFYVNLKELDCDIDYCLFCVYQYIMFDYFGLFVFCLKCVVLVSQNLIGVVIYLILNN